MLESRRKNNDDYSSGFRRMESGRTVNLRLEASFFLVLRKSVESWGESLAAMRGRPPLYLSPRAVKSKKLRGDQNLS